MSLTTLKALESAQYPAVRVAGLAFKPGAGWGFWSNGAESEIEEFFADPTVTTPKAALDALLQHLQLPAGGAGDLDALRVLERVDGSIIKEAGLDFTPDMGWGWNCGAVDPDRSAAMGFCQTPEEAWQDLVEFLTVFRKALQPD